MSPTKKKRKQLSARENALRGRALTQVYRLWYYISIVFTIVIMIARNFFRNYYARHSRRIVSGYNACSKAFWRHGYCCTYLRKLKYRST